MFEFFNNLKSRRIAFNCEEVKGVNKKSSMSSYHAAERYRSFLKSFWQLTNSSGDIWNIRDVNETINIMLGNTSFTKYENVHTLGNILSFTHDGIVSTFSPELLNAKHQTYGDFSLGSIHNNSLLALLGSDKALMMAREIEAGVQKCRSECEYFAVCGGGDPSSKVFENGSFDSSETNFCRSTVKTPADLLLSELGEQIGNLVGR
jgi:uncharacterized protein